MQTPKIIQIGFNKCGTRSLYRFFRNNGISAIHWSKGVVGRAMMVNLATGRRPFDGYEEYVFYSDLMGPTGLPVFEGHFYYREIYEAYPDSLFILNTRHEDNWIRSRQRHPAFVKRFQKHYRFDRIEDVEALWRDQWRNHNEKVRKFFADKPSQFLDFDIETGDGEIVARFVAPYYKTDPAKWGHFGKTDPAKWGHFGKAEPVA